MSGIKGSNIILGICGGIAAYKSPHIVRGLKEQGADVRVVFSPSAHKFVTKTTLQAVSGHPVRDSLWDENAEASMGHIELAKWASLVLIAPATANSISKYANGAADDLLSTLMLATEAQVFLAPSMNQKMYLHTSTQANLAKLKELGYHAIGPGDGSQACGDEGPGRMTEPDEIIEHLVRYYSTENPQNLQGLKIMITAGPTRERLDPVRYITNDSSGKQGLAIARAARSKGATVTLIAGPNVEPTDPEIFRIDVESAIDMNNAVQDHLKGTDLFIGVAAVADYRPANVMSQKIKRHIGRSHTNLELIENPDVIANVAKTKNRPIIVGFAAETTDVLNHAREKRIRKGIDAIVVNDVSDSSIGFNSAENAVTLIYEDGERVFTKKSKISLGQELIDHLDNIFELAKRKKSSKELAKETSNA